MTVLASVALAYAGLMALLWALQDRLAFPAPRSPLPDPQSVLGYGERITLTMQNGTTLGGWYLPPENGPRRPSPPYAALLWFYGNGETIGAIWPVLRAFRPPHAALLVVDYPGYGANEGAASEAGIYEAGELAYAALAARPEVDTNRIYVYGRSMGSTVATRTAAAHPVAGLVLESPLTNAREMTRGAYRIFPKFLVRLGLDNLTTIRRVQCPVLVFHGTADLLVPPEMGRRVAEAAPGPGAVEFVLIEGAGHNDTYAVGGSAYREKLSAFVR